MLSGCSFLGASRPTSGPIDRPVDCSSVLPVIDAADAVLASGLAAAAYAPTRHPPQPIDFGDALAEAVAIPFFRAVAVAAATVAGVTGTSAAYGFYEVHACRRHLADEVATLQTEARAAAHGGRCDDVVEVSGRLERAGQELDLDDPDTRACFPLFCATADSGFCACSRERSDCEAAVSAGLASSCLPDRVDVCLLSVGPHA